MITLYKYVLGDWQRNRGYLYEDLETVENALNNMHDTMLFVVDESTNYLIYSGALVTKLTDQTAQNLTTATAITWNLASYDTDGWHSTAVNTSHLTVPARVIKVNVSASVVLNNTTADEWASLVIRKNGVENYIGAAACHVERGGTSVFLTATALGVPVVETDYFEAYVQVEADNSVDILANRSNFSIQCVDKINPILTS